LFDLAYDKPYHFAGNEKRPNSELRTSNNILTEDFCILDGEHFFVRCVLRLPIAGRPDAHFGFGVWSSLSKENFDLYVDTFDRGNRGELGPWFGWFSNRLNGYPDTLNLACRVHPQDDQQRPLIELEPTDHPLAVEQRLGMTFERLIETYALAGHDLKSALSD
jgi:hypothetical protein